MTTREDQRACPTCGGSPTGRTCTVECKRAAAKTAPPPRVDVVERDQEVKRAMAANRTPVAPNDRPRPVAIRPSVLAPPDPTPAGACALCWFPVEPPHAYCSAACGHVDVLRRRTLAGTLAVGTMVGQPLTATARKEIEANVAAIRERQSRVLPDPLAPVGGQW